MRLPRLSTGLLTLCTLMMAGWLNGCGTQVTATSPAPTPTTPAPVTTSAMWVGAWGASMSNADSVDGNGGGADRSFRFLVTSTIDGTQARVKLSNVYGTTPVTIGAARLSRGSDGSAAIDTAHDVALLFNGGSGVTIPAGGTVMSDPVNVSFGLGQVMAVSLYLKGRFGPVSRHDAYFVTNYASANGAGDTTANADGSAFTTMVGDWLLVNEIDVYGQYQGTLAMFGSSTTDGFKSDYGSTQVYPVPNTPVSSQHADRVSDWMGRRLSAAGYRIGVINAGIPGNPVTELTSGAPTPGKRFTQDILGIPNLLGMVSYFGSIDLRSSECVSAPAMETATQQLVATAAAARLPIVLATLPPTALCTNPSQANYGPSPSSSQPYAGGITPGPPNGAEVQRAAFNQWLRSTAATLPGVAGIADYDSALRDPQHTSFMLPKYNSGDNYHMNGEGYGAQAQAVPLSFLPR
jgi:hypothetical protein